MPLTPRTRTNLPLYLGGYQGDSSWLSSYRCFNMYPDVVKGENALGGQAMYTLYGTPGLLHKFTIGTGPHRGAIIHEGLAYFVSGNKFIQLDSNFTQTVLGTLSTSSGSVSLSSNGYGGDQISITDGTSLYVYNSSTAAFTTVTTNVLPNPTRNLFIEGYTILLAASTNQWQISSLYDSTTYSALQTAVAEFDAGNLVAAVKVGRQLILAGENISEIWYNSGNDFPFDHVPNGLIEQGCLSADSVVNVGKNSVLWLASNEFGKGEVYMTKGFEATSVTPLSIMTLWKEYTHPERAVAFAYQEAGHVFYQITFPTDNKTWVYDVTINAWHERGSYNSAGDLGRHLANSYVYYRGMHLVGDYSNGNVYQLSTDVYTDNTTPIFREIVTYHLSDTREGNRHNWMELEGESGVGLLSGQGSNPVINLEYSDDGGHTYSNAMEVEYGIQGAYKRVARWSWLGISRNRAYRLTMSDPIRWRFARLVLDYTQMLA